MLLVVHLLVELVAAMILLGCYSEAESCVGEGTPCWEGEPAGCTLRAVCDNDTEITMEEDEAGCRKCQKPCSEKIYIMYSSKEDITPASGWYTYQQQNDMFMFTRELPNHEFFFNLKTDWTLTEWKDFDWRLITDRIELTYKNNTRTRISLHNFGIDENDLKSLNVYTEPDQTRGKKSPPYTEKLVIFCPEKCVCRQFKVKSLNNYCFEGSYKRVDNDSKTVQPNQDSADSHSVRKKRGYWPQSRSKKSYSPYDLPKYDPVGDYSIFTANAVQNDQPPPAETSKKSQNKLLDPHSTTSKPNNKPASETTSKEEQSQNWQQETYQLTSEDSSDEPFEFTYDEDYQVWFIGKGDNIAAVIPEASPCPEMIQTQPWLIIQKDFQLNLSAVSTLITCLP